MAWMIGPERTYDNLSAEKHTNLSFDAGEVGCIKVTFAYSGKVRVYTDGEDTDTVGFLSTSLNLKTDTGRPYPESSILAESDDDGDGSNFDFTCEVEADTTYYIWYRFYNNAMYGSIPLNILPPEEEDLYYPDGSETELVVTADGTFITASLEGLDLSYDGEWKAVWRVYTVTSDGEYEYILDDYEIYSGDNDFLGSFDSIVLSAEQGIQPDTTYRVYVFLYCYPDTAYQDQTGIYAKVITTGGTVSPDRPLDFAWTYPKVSGGVFNLTAGEWCELLDNFKAVLAYKGEEVPGDGDGLAQFYYPSQGEEFTALMYNQVVYRFWILGLSNYSDDAVMSNNPVMADGLNWIVETLNSIT